MLTVILCSASSSAANNRRTRIQSFDSRAHFKDMVVTYPHSASTRAQRTSTRNRLGELQTLVRNSTSISQADKREKSQRLTPLPCHGRRTYRTATPTSKQPSE